MEKIKIPKRLQKSMTFHSEYCNEHTYTKNGHEVVQPIQKMIINGQVVCPRCELEKEQQTLTESVQAYYDDIQKNKKYNTLFNKSVISDKTILAATFENYKVKIQEEIDNKNQCLEIAERLKNGQTFNTFLQGLQGAGKSHLAFSILRDINESKLDKSCLFVNVEGMMRLIKDSFSNKESKYTERYFVDLLSEVDFLVLDDIGAETGAIDTDKTATDFVQRVLYAITSTRQDKATIVTTNLSSKTLFTIYDKKLVSRLLKNPKYVIFEKTKDKRIANIPF